MCGEHRAYPVVNEEECGEFGWSLCPGRLSGCRRPRDDEAILTYTPFWLWPLSLFGHVALTRLYIDSSRVFSLVFLP